MMRHRCSWLLAFLAVYGGTSTCTADYLIDNFQSDQSLAVSGPPIGTISAQSSLADSSVAGGVRNVTITRTSDNAGQVTADSNESLANFFSFGTSNRTTGSATLVYDATLGNTTSTPNFSSGGLGHVDVTQGGLNTGTFFAADSNVSVSITFTYYTDANDYFTGTYTIPGDPNEPVNNYFENFSTLTKVGAGANLTDVNAITVTLNDGNNLSAAIGLDEFGTTSGHAPGAVPEPASLAMVAMGLTLGASLRFVRRRRKSIA